MSESTYISSTTHKIMIDNSKYKIILKPDMIQGFHFALYWRRKIVYSYLIGGKAEKL